jgi:hypothetical protein
VGGAHIRGVAARPLGHRVWHGVVERNPLVIQGEKTMNARGNRKKEMGNGRFFLPFCLFLLPFSLSLAGCNMMALPFFLIPGMEPKHDPKCRLASDDKDKEVKAIILATSGLETRAEFLRIDRELSHLLATQMKEGFKKNKEKVSVIPINQVEKYKDDHPNWQVMDPLEIGKHFEADYVITLEVNSIGIYEPGSANTLFRGRADISLAVRDVNKGAEGQIYNEEYTCEYPRVRGPIPANDSNPAQFRQRFLTVVARELSWRFTSHLVEDDHQCD